MYMKVICFDFLFVDQVAKCDETMPHKEHGDSKWAVSGASDSSQGG